MFSMYGGPAHIWHVTLAYTLVVKYISSPLLISAIFVLTFYEIFPSHLLL